MRLLAAVVTASGVAVVAHAQDQVSQEQLSSALVGFRLLILGPIFGLIVGIIAKLKSRGFWIWWLYGFLIFPIALIHVIFVSNGKPRCPHCAERIHKEAKVCRFCGRDIPPIPVKTFDAY
jgi:energy-coupling factor transporter transmembrane protein EcfT